MLFQELGKLKQTTIMYSIVLMAVGILMIICPAKYNGAMISILGYALLIVSGVMIMDFFGGDKKGAAYILFTAALFLGIMGLCTILFQNGIIKVLAILFGVLLILDGAHSLCHAFLYARKSGRKGWWVLIIFSSVLIVFGVIIFVNPWWDTPHMLLQVIGGAMLFSAIAGMLRLIWIWPLRAE